MMNNSYKPITLLLICLVVFTYLGCAIDKTSENKVKREQWLKKHPDADADKDGVLTKEEFSANYRKYKLQKQEQEAHEGRHSRIRKKRRIVPDLANIKYGAHERNVIDFWKAKSDKPTPVLVHFHAGGFVYGNKRLSRLQKECLKNGISAVSANYRFLKSKDVTLREVMHDGARVIQFLRSKAKEWNIDPTRIALSGSSAGGNMSLWLALHDDLADPKSKDPISRFSTRVTCAVAIDAQTSNDVNFIRKNIGGKPSVHRYVPLMYGVDTIKELEKPKTLKMMEEFSAINHATKDDPPIYLSYHRAPAKGLLSEKTSTFISIHSAKFGLLLKEKLSPLGIECHVGYPRNRLKESELEFLLRHFKIRASQVTPPITGGK